ncbi:hypothetical protein pdam_00003729 [Pocillopora damicornis]|uniref:Uncharacterized protein n=1 Tax=Pocillopora damicornis TaxID=46731 RepID=A0A3M6UEX4_POCDA|nr:protein PLANT CADMIUM RESISTANCE 2-like [Pocillopora damicornis]RMX52054.1 hypothetical protein pdam_00003729 [Pocillopora damicornis]
MTDWSSGLCGCFENVGICFKAFFCPCIVAGEIGEALGESCFWHCFASTLWLPGVLNGAENRGKLRAMYQIPGSYCNDFLLHLCCQGCSYAQEAREIAFRMPAGGSMARS